MISIPELDEAMKTYVPNRVTKSDFSDRDDEIISTYYGKVPPTLLVKHVCEGKKTYKQICDHKRRIKNKSTKAVSACIPADGLQGEKSTSAPGPIQETGPCPPPAKKTPPSRKGKGKWKIPFDYSTQKSQYQMAWKLCVKWQKPYAEAIRLEEEAKQKAKAKKTAPVLTTPAAPSTKAATSQPQNDSASLIRTGMHVRQVKPDAGRQMFGTGTVTSRHGEICTVRNGGQEYKILAACLTLVDGPERGEMEVMTP